MTVAFGEGMQRCALVRQRFRCASCGAIIWGLGHSASDFHKYGEHAEGHHVIPHLDGGPNIVENCVVVCRSCHINAHQGAKWGDISMYEALRQLPIGERIKTVAAEYPYYTGYYRPK